MKTALSTSSCTSGCAAPGSTNCGRKARKKIVSFGFRMFRRNAFVTRPNADVRATLPSTANADLSRQVAQATSKR
jgi:hypothetical protein